MVHHGETERWRCVSHYWIYSIPMCRSSSQYDFHLEKNLSLNNRWDFSAERTWSNADKIRSLFHWRESIFVSKKSFSLINVTKLHLDIYRKVSIRFLESFSWMINLSHLIKVELESFFFTKENERYKIDLFLEGIQSIVSSQINHFKIPIKEAK